MSYIERICTDFVELHGDRSFKDDKAIVGGFGKIDGQTVMILGQQKGHNTKMRQLRNFGMANPEGYRKALRLMKLAEKFNKPVVTLVDTPGAFPGIEAEERGQGEAIARNIFEMLRLKVPVVCVIIGEGASGGAMGIGVGDRVYMMANTWYTVISPESCSSILWRSWDQKEKAAEELKLTSDHMLGFGLVDGVIPEPVGGAHWDHDEAAAMLKKQVISALTELRKMRLSRRHAGIDGAVVWFCSWWLGLFSDHCGLHLGCNHRYCGRPSDCHGNDFFTCDDALWVQHALHHRCTRSLWNNHAVSAAFIGLGGDGRSVGSISRRYV